MQNHISACKHPGQTLPTKTHAPHGDLIHLPAPSAVSTLFQNAHLQAGYFYKPASLKIGILLNPHKRFVSFCKGFTGSLGTHCKRLETQAGLGEVLRKKLNSQFFCHFLQKGNKETKYEPLFCPVRGVTKRWCWAISEKWGQGTCSTYPAGSHSCPWNLLVITSEEVSSV